MTRDPRMDPQKGDVVRDRRVWSRNGDVIGYSTVNIWGCQLHCLVTEWQAWARDAEVVTGESQGSQE
jgi:hypothetical protein